MELRVQYSLWQRVNKEQIFHFKWRYECLSICHIFLFFFLSFFLKPHFIQHCNNLFSLNFTYFFFLMEVGILPFIGYNIWRLKYRQQQWNIGIWIKQIWWHLITVTSKCVVMICVICSKKKLTVPFKTALLHSLSSIYWPQHVCIFHMLWEHFWTVCSL